jgi:cobalt-zinc-cadmium efflux system outer membrane protein
MPSGPVTPPRGESTAAPIRTDPENVAPSPTGPPLSRPAPPESAAGRPPRTLEDFLDLAARNNPTLTQAQAAVDVSRGRAWQAGLWPNPLLGYQGEQIGARGRSSFGPAALGEHQSFFFVQEIPTANRRQISRRKFEWEAEATRWFAVAQQYRVLNSVRIHFFEALGAQQLAEDRRVLLEVADAALRTTEELVNDGQANAPDLLTAQVQQQQAEVALVAAENELRRAWGILLADAGVRGLPPARLEGPFDADAPDLDFDATLDWIVGNSPEMKGAQAEIRRDEVTVQRERVQPIPDLFVRADVGPNFVDGGVTTNVAIYGNFPVWNKNQGTIYQARGHLTQAHANLDRIRLSLEERLSNEMAQYNSALNLTRTYRGKSIPRAKQSYELLLESYRRRRAAWPQVLVAQRLWFDLQVQYVTALVELRRAETEIRGFLLHGALQVPSTPEPLQNINVSPQPR